MHIETITHGAVLVNLAIGIWILAKRPTMATNRWFFCAMMTIVFWGFFEGIASSSTTAGDHVFFERLNSGFGAAIPLFAFSFLMALRRETFGERVRGWRVMHVFLSLFTLAACVLLVGTDWVIVRSVGGTVRTLELTWLYYVIFGIVVLSLLKMFIAFFVHSRTSPDPRLRTIGLVMALAPLMPVGFYVCLEFIPRALGSPGVAIYPATLAFTLALAWASSRLDLMSISPEKAARQALEAQPDGVVLVNRTGEIKYWNSAFTSLTRSALPPLDRGPTLRDVLAIETAGYSDFFDLPWEELPDTADLKGHLAAGTTSVPVLVTFRKWLDHHGVASGAILVFRDEGPVRKLEAEMIHLEKIHSLGIMVSGVAHELNNPLTSIIGYAELGKNRAGEGDSGYFETIHKQALRAHSVVKNLVDFAGSSLSFECAMTLNGLVEEVLKLRQYELELGGHRLDLDLPSPHIETVADPHKVKQVLLNILNNASQALDAGGRAGSITVTLRRVGRTAEITVRDTGPGIPVDVLPRIFDPFFTTKSPGQGTGLGLSITQTMMADMGGRIDVESVEGQGTAVTIHIPIRATQDKGKRPSTTALPREQLLAAPRILVIDDDEDVVGMMKEALTLKGGEVEVARDGVEGLKLVLSGDYDLIFCDMKMPRLDGRGLVNALKEEAPALLPKVVLCSGDTGSPETRTFLASAGLKSLNKPFTLKQLTETVKTALTDVYSRTEDG